MRFLTTLVFYLIGINTTIAQSSGITSTITDVTIFSSGVQTVRSATTRINQGNNKLILKNLSPLIQSGTIRVTIEGNGIVQSIQYGLSTPDDQSREKERLRNEQFFAQKSDQITRLRNDLKVVNQEESMLQKNQVQVIGLTNYTLKPAELEDLIAMQNRRMTAVIARQYDLNNAITQADTQRDSLKRVIDNLKISQIRPTGELTIDVYAPQAGSIKMLINYFIPTASWTPVYDVRVKDIAQPVTLVYRASIYQQTGEDWTNVKMHLSTGNPNVNNIAPAMQPWMLRYYSPYAHAERRQVPNGRFNISGRTAANQISGKIIDGETGEALIGASVTVVNTNTGTSTDVDGNFSLILPADATAVRFTYTGFSELVMPIASARGSKVEVMLGTNAAMLEEVVIGSAKGVGISRNTFKKRVKDENTDKDDLDEGEAPATVVSLPTTLLYDIDAPVTLLPDGKPLVLDIKTYALPASYEHFTAPKLDPQVYLTAQVTGWDSLGLLSGATNLFFEGTYLGKSYLEFVTTSDTLNLSLGADQNVVATRTKIKDFSKRRFLSEQKEDSRAFDLVFKNKKTAPVHLLVLDQIPVSTKKSIEVKPADLSGATLDEKTGILEWKIDLKPGGTEKRKMGYTVRYPKGKIVVLE